MAFGFKNLAQQAPPHTKTSEILPEFRAPKRIDRWNEIWNAPLDDSGSTRTDYLNELGAALRDRPMLDDEASDPLIHNPEYLPRTRSGGVGGVGGVARRRTLG